MGQAVQLIIYEAKKSNVEGLYPALSQVNMGESYLNHMGKGGSLQ